MGSLLSSGQCKDLIARSTKRRFFTLMDLFTLRNVCVSFDLMIKKKKYACPKYHKYTQEELEPFSKYIKFVVVPGPEVIKYHYQTFTIPQFEWFPVLVDPWKVAEAGNLPLLEHAHKKGLIKSTSHEKREHLRIIRSVKKGNLAEVEWAIKVIFYGSLPLVPSAAIAEGGLEMCKFFVDKGRTVTVGFCNDVIEHGDVKTLEWLFSIIKGHPVFFNPERVSSFECAKFCSENSFSSLTPFQHLKSAVVSKHFNKEWIDWCLDFIPFTETKKEDAALSKVLFVGQSGAVPHVLEKVENIGKRYLVQDVIHRAFSKDKPQLWNYLVNKGYVLTSKCYENASWNMKANHFLDAHKIEIPNGLHNSAMDRNMFNFNQVLEYFEWLKSKGSLPTYPCKGQIDYDLAKFLVDNGIPINPKYHLFDCDVRIIKFCEANANSWLDKRHSLVQKWCREAIKKRDLVTFAWLFKTVGKPALNKYVYDVLGKLKKQPEFADWLDDNDYLDSTI